MKKTFKKLSLFIVIVLFASCSNPEKDQMQEAVLAFLKAPSTYKCINFEKNTSIVVLKDEVNDRIEHYSWRVNELDKPSVERYKKEMDGCLENIQYYKKIGWKSMVETEQTFYNDWEKTYNERLKDLEKDESILKYLNSIDTTSTETTFYHCELTYEAQNELGVPLRDVCEGRFNKDGVLVAIKLQKDSDWDITGNWFSIPNYYEMIK